MLLAASAASSFTRSFFSFFSVATAAAWAAAASWSVFFHFQSLYPARDESRWAHKRRTNVMSAHNHQMNPHKHKHAVKRVTQTCSANVCHNVLV